MLSQFLQASGKVADRPTPEARLRQMLLALVVFGIIGLVAELLLIEHTASLTQWIPLVALGAGLAAAVAVGLATGQSALRVFQVVMVGFILAGALGIYLHFAGNVEWAQERDPELGGTTLIWKAVTGATPALAPGALAQIGLLGLIYAWSAGQAASRAGLEQPQQ